MLTILTGLIRTWTGWAVMTEIFGNPKKMVIRPYHPTPKDPFNAYAAAQDVRAATMQGTPVARGTGIWLGNKQFHGDYRPGFLCGVQDQNPRDPPRKALFDALQVMHYKYRLDNPTKITLLAYSIPEFADDSNQVKWEGDTGAVSWIIEGSSGQPARPLTSSISTIWLSSSPSFAGISGVCRARLIRSFDMEAISAWRGSARPSLRCAPQSIRPFTVVPLATIIPLAVATY